MRAPLRSEGTALLTARAGSSYLLRGGEGYVAITMKAPDLALARRAPASVAIVLDTSGSMDDEHRLADAKAAADSLLDRLGDDDEVALVTYSTAAELILPLSRATGDTKAKAREAIASMTANGGTNISGGIGLGADALAAAHTSVRRLVLISDGEPTEGLGAGLVVDPRPLVAFAGRRAAEGTSITTVGVGLTFREDIMAGIASAGRGNYYFAEQASDLEDLFARELGALGETVVTGGDLTLQPGPGVELVDAIGYPLVRDADGVRVPVADLRRGEQRKVVVRVHVDGAIGSEARLAASWRFHTVAGETVDQVATARATVTGDASQVERGRDRAAVQLIEEARTARALDDASAAFGRGDSVDARRILVEQRAAVQAHAADLDQKMVEDLQQATDRAARGFAEAPAASAPAGLRAMKDNSAAAFELAH
ncbi:MAG TPA: VWA domain-containing protein [Kofleriaceae bacterium]|nr:VWA domain-containing protein [Kofleriaceae bacterium]